MSRSEDYVTILGRLQISQQSILPIYRDNLPKVLHVIQTLFEKTSKEDGFDDTSFFIDVGKFLSGERTWYYLCENDFEKEYEEIFPNEKRYL